MDKVIELAREARFTVGRGSAALPKHQKFYTLARADLEAENAKLRQALERVYVTCDWHGDDGRDAMQAAYAALGEK